jgi:hypothetical protein
VPYVVDPATADGFVRIGRADGSGPELVSFGSTPQSPAAAYRLDGAHLHASLAEEAVVAAGLDPSRGVWTPQAEIVDSDGIASSSVRRAADGSVALPFDIDEAFDNLLEERYLPSASRVGGAATSAYYRARPVIPYSVQMMLRRRFKRLQDRAVFPVWPTETSLHRLEAFVLTLVEGITGEPLPWLSPWPAPHSWALVLTHDIERLRGYRHLDEVLALEERMGFRSACYFVPERDYSVEESLLERLRRAGCEICLHGLHHDGRDLSPGAFQQRLPAMRSYLERWQAHGFRGPATHRDWRLVQELGVDHDSSWSDVARYEPQPGGTCSWLPFFIGDVVELPITLPMDHTLFELQQVTSPEPWIEKTAFLREQGGMALMVTHPDYLLEEERLRAYESFLERQTAEPGTWRALPNEVASWWRRRADSHLERDDDRGWSIVGPAAEEGQVRLGAPLPPPPSNGPMSR